MKNFVEDFLQKHHLSEYISAFTKNGFTNKQFLLLLTDKEIKELIPVLAHRLQFAQAFTVLLDNEQKAIDNEMDSALAAAAAIEEIDESNDQDSVLHQNTKIVLSNPPDDSDTFELPFFETIVADETPQEKDFLEKENSSSAVNENLKIASRGVRAGRVEKRSTAKKSVINKTKDKKTEDSSYLKEYDANEITEEEKEKMREYLTEVLNATLNGRTVLKAYELNKFDDNMRKYLIDSVINHELNSSIYFPPKITADMFKYIAMSISLSFPSESPFIYYIPGISKGPGPGKKINAKGKLYEHYVRRRRIYITYGLCEKNSQAAIENDSEEEGDSLNLSEEAKSAIDHDLNWLKFGSEPFTELSKKWVNTTQHRLHELLYGNISSADYMLKFAALRKDFGHRLLTLDFQHLHPEKDVEFFNKWPIAVERIIEFVLNKCKKNSGFKKLIESRYPQLFLESQGEERNYFAISLLPFLLRPGTKDSEIKNSKKKVTTTPYSQQESLESLIFSVSTPNELSIELKSRNQLAAKKPKAKKPIQPLIILVGTDPQNFDRYVEVNETLYSETSITAAIDVCFKTFFSLNLKYPAACERVWVFIQRHLYKITTQGKIDPDVELLATNLKLDS